MESAWKRFTLRLFGKPKDLFDPGHLSPTVPDAHPGLDWPGGRDGLSSFNLTGPEEAFSEL
jgi:hypothetical protein